MNSILIICTGNSCRSQMAEGYFRYFAKEETTVYSAGTRPEKVNTNAIQVMMEDGIDISSHTSNNVSEYTRFNFDYIITVCDSAKENCPYFPAKAQRFHHSFTDPANACGSKEDILQQYREVRDRIKEFAREFINQHQL